MATRVSSTSASFQWLWESNRGSQPHRRVTARPQLFVACNAGEWDCFGHLDDKVVASQFLGEGDTTVANRGVFQMSNRLSPLSTSSHGSVFILELTMVSLVQATITVSALPRTLEHRLGDTR